jgi:4-amino-4-deoxy-L-arabinose transferase-like glycosyltransferase
MGMFLVWYSTVWGAGLISDTYQYTASARNFVSGNGFSLPYGNGELEPMTKYPPMYSVLLAVYEGIGISALQGARLANTLLFGVNILLVFLSTLRLTRSDLFSFLAALLFSISFVMVEVHSWALSEPLYICLGLSAFLLLQKYFEEGRASWLVLAALFVSAAFLTRYVGLSLVISIGIVLFIQRIELRRRFSDLFLFGVIAVLPMALWTLRGYLLTQTINDRAIGFYPLTVKNYVSAIDVVYGWLLPPSFVQGEEKLLLALTAILLIGIVLLFVRYRRSQITGLLNSSNPEQRILLLHILCFTIYGLVIFASKTWIDPDIGLSDRILSPMLVSLLILLVAGFSFLWKHFGRIRPLVTLLSLGLIAYYGIGTFTAIRAFNESGIGIARRGWNRSEVVQSLRSYPSYTMYTNSNSSLYLWSDRTGYSIPEFEQIKETGSDQEVLLVIFHHVPPSGRRLNQLIEGLNVLAEDQVVSIYSLSPE